MKVWQLLVCLENEDNIFEQYFPNIELPDDGRNEIDNSVVISALSQSTKRLYVDPINYLRFYVENNNSDPVVTVYSILEAYNNFGGDAITEVFDYGSYPL
ncbi:hypothetical protein [Pedobacter nyackensis]|uniref:Uncharacterized protein n=1 Tax=Pedobacter nyackensis TaxID=475255 RepID=A0A1W2A1H0_9SPHI|nr:hypothetical protein [Pedobacter nyackensis]SMC54271.1 hypothetical protein SAMN04488101_101232 [Pedobacter nyackensis]